jgi:hypothetical protein
LQRFAQSRSHIGVVAGLVTRQLPKNTLCPAQIQLKIDKDVVAETTGFAQNADQQVRGIDTGMSILPGK